MSGSQPISVQHSFAYVSFGVQDRTTGGYLQSSDKSGAAIGILSAPGAGGMPWERQAAARGLRDRIMESRKT